VSVPEPGSSPLELAPERLPPAEEADKGFWQRLRRGLARTQAEIASRLSGAFEGRRGPDQETWDYLEVGVEVAGELVARVQREAGRWSAVDLAQVKSRLAEEIALLLLQARRPPETGTGPRVTLVVGVNGVGKTTSIAKLARRAQAGGEKVLLAAADTFRAAAIEQLELWGQRLGVPVVRQSAGADPAAVVYDALAAARARGATEVLVDTAGRLHTKENLMAELGKVRRVVEREAADWRRRTLLVLDATTGQNALAQARRFAEVAEVDGVLLAKLDGTAKGGMAVAVARELKLPVLYLGVGESPEDLVEFRPREFASALLG
jgi:fused signal recognition particle receptor